MTKLLVFISLISFYIVHVYPERLGEVHTSAAQMSQLVLMESQIVSSLNQYIQKEKDRLKIIQRYIDEWQDKEPEFYVDNPLNSYHFMQRMYFQFKEVYEAISDNATNEVLKGVRNIRSTAKVPNESDVNGVAWALVRLQYTYNLTIDDLTDGFVSGAPASKGLTVDDCLRFAQQSFKNLEFDISEKWAAKAIDLLEEERPLSPQTLTRIESIKTTTLKKMMMRGLVTDLAKKSSKMVAEKFSGLGVPSSFQQSIHDPEEGSNYIEEVENNYQRLCRGDHLQPKSAYSSLTCSYIMGGSLYRLLMPFKVELIWPDPILLIYHDILNDREAQLIQDLAFPKLETTLVHSYVNHNTLKSMARVGKGSWVKSGENPHIDRILQRIDHMTGLSMEYAEDFHILNYGIGGHYDVHVDYLDLLHKEIDPCHHGGDRMATVLFYLNDVAAGGATVFPLLKIGVAPEKGSVLFWFNLQRNGRGDYRTLHASCPVLLGQKWIANLWIHDFGNEFRWSCKLDSTE